jgi:hypothetical protein
MTRAAAFLHDQLVALRGQPGGESLRDDFLPCLLKALLVHGAGWATASQSFRQIFRDHVGDTYTSQARSVHEKNAIARFIGFGSPDLDRVRFSDDHRVTVLGCGRLKDEEAHEFVLPLPVALSGLAVMKRLVVTLAWMTPINPLHAKYRQASLWVEAPCDDMRLARRDADWRTVRRGTVQHEIFEGTRAVVIPDGASITIKVNCRAEAGKLRTSVPYAVVVTLEVAPELGLNIYSEIQARIRPPVGIQI